MATSRFPVNTDDAVERFSPGQKILLKPLDGCPEVSFTFEASQCLSRDVTGGDVETTKWKYTDGVKLTQSRESSKADSTESGDGV